MGEETKKKEPDSRTDQELETKEETTVTEEQQESREENSSALDKVLEDPDLKAEFDARVQEAVDAALADKSAGGDAATDEAAAEGATDDNAAEKEAEGSTDGDPEAGAPEEDSRAKDLDAREKSLLQRELRATAIEELSREHLPAALADCFNYGSDESFRASKEKCIKAFQDAVKEAVNERLRGSRTPKASGEGAKGSARRTSFADTINKANKR